jgi:hypothetical protein
MERVDRGGVVRGVAGLVLAALFVVLMQFGQFYPGTWLAVIVLAAIGAWLVWSSSVMGGKKGSRLLTWIMRLLGLLVLVWMLGVAVSKVVYGW